MTRTGLNLLPGFAMAPRVFAPLIQALGQAVECLAYALPGYPESACRADANLAREIDCLAEQMPPGALLGWSLGGLYAIELARRYPERFHRLILVACNPKFVRDAAWPAGVTREDWQAFMVAFERNRTRCLRHFVRLQVKGDDVARFHACLAHDTDEATLRLGLSRLHALDLYEALGQLPQDCDLILGAADRLLGPGLETLIAQRLPQIRLHRIADAGHAPFFDQPGRVAATLAPLTGI